MDSPKQFPSHMLRPQASHARLGGSDVLVGRHTPARWIEGYFFNIPLVFSSSLINFKSGIITRSGCTLTISAWTVSFTI